MRYRLIAGRCGSSSLAYAGDFPPSGPGGPLEAAVPPDEVYYLWLQGWTACDVDRCEPEDSAFKGDCLCFGALSPAYQKLAAEACTGWLSGDPSGGSVELSLGKPSDQCPPPPRTECTPS